MIPFLNYNLSITLLITLFLSFLPALGLGQNTICEIYPKNRITPLMEICFPENWEEVNEKDGTIFHIIPKKRNQKKPSEVTLKVFRMGVFQNPDLNIDFPHSRLKEFFHHHDRVKILDTSWMEIKGVKMFRMELKCKVDGKRTTHLNYIFEHPGDTDNDDFHKAWHFFSFKSKRKWYKRYRPDAEAIVRSVVWKEKDYENYWKYIDWD